MVSACSSFTFLSSPDIAPIIRILADKRDERGRKIDVVLELSVRGGISTGVALRRIYMIRLARVSKKSMIIHMFNGGEKEDSWL